MKRNGILLAFVLTPLVTACAHSPSFPATDRSPNVDFTSIRKQVGWRHCKVSVPLTEAEVIKAAKLNGDPRPEERTEWAAIIAEIRPGDQLRQVSCFQKGPAGYPAGDIFYALFRDREMVAQMHTIIIN